MSLCLQYKTVPGGERFLFFFRGAWHGMAWDGMGLGLGGDGKSGAKLKYTKLMGFCETAHG